jgi:hypothetical protein
VPDDPDLVFVTLQPLPDSIAPEIRIRQLLKYALRAQRLRCVSIRLGPAREQTSAAGPQHGGQLP